MSKIDSPTENKIVSVAMGLSFGVSVEDIRADLIKEGYTEHAVFLTVKAAEVHNIMSEKVYTPHD